MKKIIELNHFAQYLDITDPVWQSRSCGIAALAMILDFYGKKVDLDDLVQEGIELGGYDPKFGWRHDGIVNLAQKYGLKSHRTEDETIENLKESIGRGEPVIISIYKKFNPKNGGHLAVLNGYFESEGEIEGFYINDPLGEPYFSQNQFIKLKKFLKGWKKRAIYVRKG